ncbi:MAG: cytochrome c oxidase subunit II [Hyphomicrobiales bacterium]|nr:cytochrome c oxidase subunit II [Hyphomicrobiales bacterium]MDE2016390.1 cytochrome c oxidase subunit II [Hyphomicrobiales bacterium]
MPVTKAFRRAASRAATFAAAFAAAPALAQTYGRAAPGQAWFQPPVTQVARDTQWFHDWVLMPVITVISLFVLALLVYVAWRFSEKRNPTPSKTTHNTMIEVLWTVVPVLILVFMAVPSFRLLSEQMVEPPADLVVKVTGNQWYWSYEYPKALGGFSFDSNIVPSDKLTAQQKADGLEYLAVDNEAVVPVGKVVRLDITADPNGVIHSFTVPSFGVRMDAVPGRLNETWFKADRPGTYYGQCSKLCGKNHAFMPIAFRVVTDAEFQAWVAQAKQKFADAAPAESPVRLAAAR